MATGHEGTDDGMTDFVVGDGFALGGRKNARSLLQTSDYSLNRFFKVRSEHCLTVVAGS